MCALVTVFRATLLLLLPPLALLSYACGDGDETSGEPAASFPAGGGGAGGEADVHEFDISLGDNTIEPAEVSVSGAKVLQFNITNEGAAIHNVRIAGADNVYNNEDDAVSDPSLLNGGETAVVQWPAPVAGGTFDFRCDFHPEAMVGTIVVEKEDEASDGGVEGP